MESNENYPDKKREYIIISVLGVLLLGSLGYNIYQNQEQKTISEHFAIDLQDEEYAKALLQKELDSLTSEFEKTREGLDVRDSLLSKRDLEIFDKQKEIQNILNKKDVSESELKQARRMIAALNADIGRFKLEIKELKQLNDSLWVANETLHTEKESISEELINEKEKAEETESSVRGTFSISNYQLTGVQVKRSGKEVETDKAKRIDKLRVSFDIDPNSFAESGPKEIFIALYKPDGTLGKFKDASPGELETWSLGKVQYSDKVRFNYTKGNRQNITFDWGEYDFPKGVYKIDLYQNGFKIGQKSLELK
ncbi:MAG: hypothetical protein WCY25_04615 [Moheibacter sp.]